MATDFGGRKRILAIPVVQHPLPRLALGTDLTGVLCCVGVPAPHSRARCRRTIWGGRGWDFPSPVYLLSSYSFHAFLGAILTCTLPRAFLCLLLPSASCCLRTAACRLRCTCAFFLRRTGSAKSWALSACTYPMCHAVPSHPAISAHTFCHLPLLPALLLHILSSCWADPLLSPSLPVLHVEALRLGQALEGACWAGGCV